MFWLMNDFLVGQLAATFKMASFVNFLKSALFPSVKAQDDVVNPQEVLKVISIDCIIQPIEIDSVDFRGYVSQSLSLSKFIWEHLWRAQHLVLTNI